MNFADGTILERTSLDRAQSEFVYNASTDKGSSGSPIFLKGTTKVIGIHKSGGVNKDLNKNFGDFIWPIFCYFKNFQKIIIKIQNNNNNNNNLFDDILNVF
jgi:V8-like Glu-specific endopeptidase